MQHNEQYKNRIERWQNSRNESFMVDWQLCREDTIDKLVREAACLIPRETLGAAHRLLLVGGSESRKRSGDLSDFKKALKSDSALHDYLDLSGRHHRTLFETAKKLWHIDEHTETKKQKTLEVFLSEITHPFYLFHNSRCWENLAKYLLEFQSLHPDGEFTVHAAKVVVASPLYKHVVLNSPISEIVPICKLRDAHITPNDNLVTFIEAPLLSAISHLNRLGIKTCMCSANQNDVKKGYGYIMLYYHNFSLDNLEVLNQLQSSGRGTFTSRGRDPIFTITFPVCQKDTVQSIRDSMDSLLRKFTSQTAPLDGT